MEKDEETLTKSIKRTKKKFYFEKKKIYFLSHVYINLVWINPTWLIFLIYFDLNKYIDIFDILI